MYLMYLKIIFILLDAVASNMLTTGPNSNTDGDTHLCSSNLGYTVERFYHSCYELHYDSQVSWMHGQEICSGNGGYLTSIENANEQEFVQTLMQRHYPNQSVWIGLHDRDIEGHYQWISGEPVTYTNWISTHIDNDIEDCVVFIPFNNGVWDVIPCGHQMPFEDVGEVHPFLCEYDISRISQNS